MEELTDKSTTNVPIVLVEIGRAIPGYVKRNLKFLRSNFPLMEIILVTDQDFKSSYIKVIQTSTLKTSPHLESFDLLKKTFTHKQQQNYWMATTRRFFYLEMLMNQKNLTRIIHIESDILVLNHISLLNESDLQFELAYSMQNESLGCAGVFIVNSLSHLRDFLDFINFNWSKPNITDMNLLAMWRNTTRNDSQIRILRPIPLSLDSCNANAEYLMNFDPGDYGIFFFGNDARHNRLPFRKIRQVPNPGSFALLEKKSKHLRGSILGDKNQGYLFRISDGDQHLDFCTLHMHSKILPRNILTLKFLILKRNLTHKCSTNDYTLFPLPSLDFLVLFERITSYISRRYLKSSRYAEIRLR